MDRIRPARPPRRTGRRGRCALAQAALAVVLAAAAGRAAADGDLAGRGVVTYRSIDSDGYDLASVLQSYELRVQRRPSDPILYRGFLRYQDERGGASSRGVRSGIATRLVEPSFELVLTPGSALFQSGYDLTLTDDRGGSRRLDRASATLALRPEGLPALSLRAERRGTLDRGLGLDTTDTAVDGTVEWSWRGLHLAQLDRVSEFADARTTFRRRVLDVGGLAELQGPFDRGRGQAQAGWRVTWSGIEESTGGFPASASVPQRPPTIRALWGVDSSPDSSADVPLAPAPQLVDGASGATAFSLGPLAPSFQNFAIDFAVAMDVDELRVEVRDPEGQAVPSASGVTWSVYASADGVTWLLVTASPSGGFNPARSAWEVQFPVQKTRFVKAVSSGVSSTEIIVTEVTPYARTAVVTGEQRRSDALVNSGTASLTWRPRETLALSWGGNVNLYRASTPSAAAVIRSLDWTQSAGATWDPLRLVGLQLRWDKRRAEATGGPASDSDVASAAVRITPRQQLQTVVGGSRQWDRNGVLGGPAVATVTDTVQLRQTAQLLPALLLTGDGSFGRQVRSIDGAATDRVAVSSLLRAGLTPTVTVQLGGSVQRAGSVDPAYPAVLDQRGWGELAWRPSSQLDGAARVGWAQGARSSGMTDQLRLQWTPFPGGALQLATAIDQDQDLALGQRIRRVALSPRWTINRSARFDVSFLLVERAAETTTRSGSLYATLTFNL